MLGPVGTGLLVVGLLLGFYYQEENWRGRKAWAQVQSELAASGKETNWAKLIPPPIPDDQNVLAAPHMRSWFVGRGWQKGWIRDMDSNKLTNFATPAEFVAWSDRYQTNFEIVRTALKRPSVRINCDYSKPAEIQIPNFITLRVLSQHLAGRAESHLQLNQPGEALRDLTLVHEICRILESKPTLLVNAMIETAMTTLYVQSIDAGLRTRAWREQDLMALQEQLEGINLPARLVDGMEFERIASCASLEKVKASEWRFEVTGQSDDRTVWKKLQDPVYRLLLFAPRGIVYQNLATIGRIHQLDLTGVDKTTGFVNVQKANLAFTNAFEMIEHGSFSTFAAIAIPNFSRASQTAAGGQTSVIQARVKCALERYHLAHKKYPETITALVPQYIDRIQPDATGKPLNYWRGTNDDFDL